MPAKPKTPPQITSKDVALIVANPGPNVEMYVQKLPTDGVPVFLARALPLKKMLERAVKLAEARVAVEQIINRGGSWMDTESGVLYTWDGEIGDPELGDPAGCYTELQMLDVDVKDLDATFFKIWKTDFNNLKRIESMGVRMTKSGNKDEAARGARIVETIKNYRSRKPDGPAHLKEKQ